MYKATSLVRKSAPVKNPTFQMSFKAIEVKEDGSIEITGFASTPEVDRYDDIVNPVAFKNAMEGYMKNPVVLLGHNPDKVIGQVTKYTLDKKGLEVTAKLTNDIDSCFKNIADKNLRGFSIGFICKAWGYRDEGSKQVREITDLDLIEISVVSTPANPSSLFSMAKSFRLLLDQEEKKNADAEEVKEEPKTNTEGDELKTDPNTTEGEDKGGETPLPDNGTPPEEGKTDDVKGDVKPEEWKALTEDEVKSLVKSAVENATSTLTTAFEAKLKEVTDAKTALEEKVSALETKNKGLEEDIARIPVNGVTPKTDTKSYITDSMWRQSNGYPR